MRGRAAEVTAAAGSYLDDFDNDSTTKGAPALEPEAAESEE